MSTLKLAILPGDPAGIGYEITAKALAEPHIAHMTRPHAVILYAHDALFRRGCTQFAPALRPHIRHQASDIDAAGIYLVPVMDDADLARDMRPGVPDAVCAQCAHQAIIRCAQDARMHLIDGMCTGPIHKGAMRLADVPDIGHTEMLARAFDAANPTTLFITRALRIFFYSRHLSLRQAIDALDKDHLVAFGRRVYAHLRELGFEHPRIALAALNPHASDGGQFGDEERTILEPAVAQWRAENLDILGPIGADSVFAQAAKRQFDAVISLYHDQGHIAAKTYDFDRTISATLGLPILRTSVDHGTAFDIAWKGTAQSVSMQTAIETLAELLANAKK